MSDSAKSIASMIIEELKTRNGLMEDWDDIDLDIQEEILETLTKKTYQILLSTIIMGVPRSG